LIYLDFQTKTVLNTITSTLVENRTYLQTTTFLSTATATTTEVQKVLETGLSDCLGKVCCSAVVFFLPSSLTSSNSASLLGH
jgi:hypothetical protein